MESYADIGQTSKVIKYYLRKLSIQAMGFRPHPFHANYILNVYDMSYINQKH